MENNKISNFLDIKNVSQLINEIEKQDITARDKMHLIKELEKFPDFLNNMDWGDDEYFSNSILLTIIFKALIFSKFEIFEFAISFTFLYKFHSSSNYIEFLLLIHL